MIIIPKDGMIADSSRVFEGEEYAKFSPSIMEELPPAQEIVPTPVVPASKATLLDRVPLTAPAQSTAAPLLAEPNSSLEDALSAVEDVIPATPQRRKKRTKRTLEEGTS